MCGRRKRSAGLDCCDHWLRYHMRHEQVVKYQFCCLPAVLVDVHALFLAHAHPQAHPHMSTQLRRSGHPFDGAWCLVCELCLLAVICVDCRCCLAFVFLGGAMCLKLSLCNTAAGACVMAGLRLLSISKLCTTPRCSTMEVDNSDVRSRNALL